jgi:BlaI family transcriptional regulator, penicillinase repressor
LLSIFEVLSVMQKLERAGWLRHREEGRTYIYQAIRTKEEEGVRALRGFLDKVFRGDPLLLFQHLLETPELDEASLGELRKMIEE